MTVEEQRSHRLVRAVRKPNADDAPHAEVGNGRRPSRPPLVGHGVVDQEVVATLHG
jgi:hypothetical protein